jgi:putative membrane protein
MLALILKVVLSSCAGTLVSVLIGWMPALHVYNIAMLFIIFHQRVQATAFGSDPQVMMPFMMGLIVGWTILNTVPTVFLGAPDESAVLMVFPTQKYLMQGRGYEATMLTAVGALGGVICLLAVAPLLSKGVQMARTVLTPHYFWILMLVLAYMVLSEFPKGGDRGPTRLARFWDAWKSLLAGWLTLALAGWLGFILMRRPPINSPFEFTNIMPAFVGLFGIPWVIQNIMSGTEVPRQHVPASVDCTGFIAFRGVTAGFLGGFFAAYMPIITGGIGGLLAGHATAQNDERAFIVSQGASKLVYYVGAFLLLFVPMAGMARGGMANMMRTVYVPRGEMDYYMILGAMAIAAAVAFFMLHWVARATIVLIKHIDYRILSYATLGVMVILVAVVTRLGGLIVMSVSTGIGLIPVLFHSRRSHCMGVLLIPVALDMAGYGATIARWLGLS